MAVEIIDWGAGILMEIRSPSTVSVLIRIDTRANPYCLQDFFCDWLPFLLLLFFFF